MRPRANSELADAVSPTKFHPRMDRTSQRGPGYRPPGRSCGPARGSLASVRPRSPLCPSASECPLSGRAPSPQRGWRSAEDSEPSHALLPVCHWGSRVSAPPRWDASCDRPLERGSFSLLTMLVLLSVSNLIAFHSSSSAFHAELLCHARGGWALRRRVGDRLSPQVTAEVPCCVEKGTERESRRVCRRPEPAPGPGCLTAS